MDYIGWFLKEDLDTEGDVTSNALFTDEHTTAHILCEDSCILAGIEESRGVFKRTGATLTTPFSDGDPVEKGTIIASITGTAKSILSGERIALNIIARMSSIATETKTIVDLTKSINPHLQIAATRKTTPGFRSCEKHAVVIGGGIAHRQGLYDAVMIKDNHLALVGNLKKAVQLAKDNAPGKTIEVEVENIDQATLAATLDVDSIMLDNFDATSAAEAYTKIKQINPNIIVEISGGITPENIQTYAPYADRISLGYLTHSIISKSFRLEIFMG